MPVVVFQVVVVVVFLFFAVSHFRWLLFGTCSGKEEGKLIKNGLRRKLWSVFGSKRQRPRGKEKSILQLREQNERSWCIKDGGGVEKENQEVRG